MILKLPAPTYKNQCGQTVVDDIWEMVHVYQCSVCVRRWSMAEVDDKPDFCPYCGKERIA